MKKVGGTPPLQEKNMCLITRNQQKVGAEKKNSCGRVAEHGLPWVSVFKRPGHVGGRKVERQF